MAASAKNGIRGLTSRSQERMPLFHQNMTRRPTGRRHTLGEKSQNKAEGRKQVGPGAAGLIKREMRQQAGEVENSGKGVLQLAHPTYRLDLNRM
jgi:hypothetical protein